MQPLPPEHPLPLRDVFSRIPTKERHVPVVKLNSVSPRINMHYHRLNIKEVLEFVNDCSISSLVMGDGCSVSWSYIKHIG